MDFKILLNSILNAFKKEDVRYGLIGGFALGALGIPRATIDLDFLVDRNDLLKVDKILRELGYECVYKTDDVSQYISPVKIFGEIDFIHAFRKASKTMLERAIEKDIFEGELKIKVLIPEDIIGLKLQAISNNNERATREYADIESIMEYYKEKLNWELLCEYFTLFSKKDKYNELKERFYNAK